MNYYANLSAIAPVLRSFSGEGLAKAEQTQSNPISACPSAAEPKRQIISNIKSGPANLQPASRLSTPVSLVVVSARSPVAEKLTGKKLIILSLDSILSAV